MPTNLQGVFFPSPHVNGVLYNSVPLLCTALLCGCLLESQPCVNMALEHGGIFLKLEFLVFLSTPLQGEREVFVCI